MRRWSRISVNFNFSKKNAYMKEPRGLRNNNPLNLRHGRSRWQGMSKEQPDREFVCYMSKAYGYRAAWKVLDTYYRNFTAEGRPFTLSAVIHRWAPPEDGNDTTAYLHRVIRLTHLPGHRPLPRPATAEGRAALRPVLAAMTCVENGIRPEAVPVQHIEKGWALAFPDAAPAR